MLVPSFIRTTAYNDYKDAEDVNDSVSNFKVTEDVKEHLKMSPSGPRQSLKRG